MRKLSGKTINSLALCVALAAPLVYLFGTLFMSLAGAHGNYMFTEEKPDLSITYNNQSYKRVVYGDYYAKVIIGNQGNIWLGQGPSEEKEALCSDNLNWTNYTNIKQAPTTSYIVWEWNAPNQKYTFLRNRLQTNDCFSLYFKYEQTTSYYIEFFPTETWVYEITETQAGHQVTSKNQTNTPSIEINMEVTTYNPFGTLDWQNFDRYIPEKQPSQTNASLSAVDNTNFLFSQFFARDNFLAESGREVLNGTPLYGFEPIGKLVRYTDANMLHLANLSYGPLVIGYTYYCAHVIIVDLIFYISSFIPRLIKKTINKLEGGLD